MIIANKDFHSPFTGLIVYKGQAVLVPAHEKDGETFKKLMADGTIRDSDTAIGPYGSAPTEGVHDRSNLTERDLPHPEPQRIHDGTVASARAHREAMAKAQAERAAAAAKPDQVETGEAEPAAVETVTETSKPGKRGR